MEGSVREEEIEDVQILECNVNLTSPPCKRQEAHAHETIGIHEIIVGGILPELGITHGDRATVIL